MIQQRSVTSREELKDSILHALVKQVPGGRNGPDETMLMKANSSATEIMSIIDHFLDSRGIR